MYHSAARNSTANRRDRLASADDLRWKGLTQHVPGASMDDRVAVWEPVLSLLDGAGFLLREQHQRKPTAPQYATLDRRGSAPRL